MDPGLPMKRCPRCNARFDDGRTHCLHDGAALVDAVDPMLGRTLAERYRLVQRIGAGGMGTVYRAQHLLLRRDVALKLLSPELTRDPVMRERFLREAQATNMLRHPNIVEVFDVATDGSRVFLVMELLVGDSLASCMGAGPMEVIQALRFVRPVAAALARAHSLGVVHRDIKPENVFVSRATSGEFVVKVLDFGIAHLRYEARLTAPGEVFGTPEYLAPELARGESCQPASDLYAVGVMLFEMVTGALPFDGDMAAIIEHHRATPAPSARARNPALPTALDDLILRLMAKDPGARPPSAAALGEMLDSLLGRLDPAYSGVRKRLGKATLSLGGNGRDDDPDDDDDTRKTVPRSLDTPPSLATLRQHRATFEAAVAVAYPDGPTDWVAETLRALNAAMMALDTVESQRRAVVREIADHARQQQARREALLDSAAEASRALSLAEAELAAAVAHVSEARGQESALLNTIALRWDDLGTPSPHPGLMDEARAAQMESLGAEATRWRELHRRLAGLRSAQAAAEARVESARQTLAGARDAVAALERATQSHDEAMRARAVQTGIELDVLYGFVQKSADALAAHLRDLPAARGLITWLGPVAHSA